MVEKGIVETHDIGYRMASRGVGVLVPISMGAKIEKSICVHSKMSLSRKLFVSLMRVKVNNRIQS
jgi:hypothetical protein